jgi:hypothetical protein
MDPGFAGVMSGWAAERYRYFSGEPNPVQVPHASDVVSAPGWWKSPDENDQTSSPRIGDALAR